MHNTHHTRTCTRTHSAHAHTHCTRRNNCNSNTHTRTHRARHGLHTPTHTPHAPRTLRTIRNTHTTHTHNTTHHHQQQQQRHTTPITPPHPARRPTATNATVHTTHTDLHMQRYAHGYLHATYNITHPARWICMRAHTHNTQCHTQPPAALTHTHRVPGIAHNAQRTIRSTHRTLCTA